MAITIKNHLFSAPDKEGGTVDFKDPWFIDYPDPQYGNNLRNRGMNDSGPDAIRFWTRNSPFNPDSNSTFGQEQYKYRGVFLNEGGPPFWNPPYYTVRVPQTQTISFHNYPITWYFLNWEGDGVEFQDSTSGETAVVFTDANAEVRALYKGHLASSNSEATGFNNGRRVVWDGENVLHAIYEDNKQIWYTKSVDFGEHWERESIVENIDSDLGNEYIYPSIAENNGILHVAYTGLEIFEGELSSVKVLYRWKNIEDEQWDLYNNYKYVASFSPELTVVPKPALEIYNDGGTDYVVISFNRPDEPSQIVTYYKKLSASNFTASPSVITGENPSLSSDESHYTLRLCYEDGDIYLRKWLNEIKTWDSARIVSEDTWWILSNKTPNVSYTTDTSDPRSHIVWAGKDETLIPYVLYRTFKIPASPGELYYFPDGGWNSPLPHPTVAVEEGIVTIYYEEEGRIIKRWFDGEVWLEDKIGDGRFPNIIAHGQNGALWTMDSSSPYRIQSDYEDPQALANTVRSNPPDTLIVNKRLDYTFRRDTTEGYLTLEIQQFSSGNRWLQLDSLLFSRELTLPANGSLKYNLLVRFHNLSFQVDSQQVLFKLEFKESNRTHLLRTLPLKVLLHFNDEQYHTLPVNLSLAHLKGKRGRFKVSLGAMRPLISNMVVRPDSAMASLVLKNRINKGETPATTQVPREFSLAQNYPNPFNPETVIRFALPQQSNVKLTIYDVSGRQVRVLVNEPMPAAYHTALWDGQNDNGVQVGTGVYFYRITAGDPFHRILRTAGSGQYFSQVRKMLLVR
ncbi:MAG: T9SS type A sorting domain-containing protein [Calditrichia bacterium]